ncbi:uncharacterized protein Dwil_GK23733 [Drosophila willistoni]|uniref:Cilia- and flagella-associated protein 299 n=1 Tax=Drosophila willistoni TaxID=7260 RepID=B4MU09_DROWI|nr:cilia- and flagella-associated protein 299 isoform X1 [Drosophila willistoni]EDW75598.1 uncharacterized protein Dwil_GK23733 [Drosophila willistoni]
MDLLPFNSYEEYIDHFITIKDVRYLRNIKVQRKLIKNACGKSCVGNLLSRKEFVSRREKALDMLQPPGLTDSQLFGDHLNSNDQVLKQLARREKILMQKRISTVIFLIMRSSRGLEISSFIDLEQSFREAHFHSSHPNYIDWRGIFEGKVKLMPRKHDLSHFDWHKNSTIFNNSDNFLIISEGAHSLLLMHCGDHKMICVNAGCDCPYSRNATRSMFYSNTYGNVIFFDHSIRRMN